MSNKFLILGATGGIGFAFTNELLKNKESATILARDKRKAKNLFHNNPNLEIIEGDIKDLVLLKRISIDKQYIFFGINFPYKLWGKEFTPALLAAIEATSQNNATILYPENNYSFGNIQNAITENTVHNPTTKKGSIRLEMIQILKKATSENKCKAIIVRLPDFYGPNVTNGLIKPIFGNAVKNKPINWVINANIPHQFVYTPDAARLFYMLAQESSLSNYFLINYGGITISSINELSKKISAYAKSPEKVKVAPKLMLNILGLFVPEIRELKENFYQFEESIIIDDSKLYKLFPKSKSTKIDETLKETLEWYKENINNLP